MEADLAEELKKTHIYVYPEDTKLIRFPNFTYLSAGELLSKSEDQKLKSIGLWAIARLLLGCSSYVFGRKQFTKLDLLFESIKCDPENFYAYTMLGKIIFISIILPDGNELTSEELFMFGIKYGYSEAYYNLASSIYDNKIYIINDKPFTQIEVYMRAIELNPDNYKFYLTLCSHLKLKSVTINDQVFTKVDLLLKALELISHTFQDQSEDLFRIYKYLGDAVRLKDDMCVTLYDGRVMTANKLFIEALKYDSEDGWNLSMKITYDECWSQYSHHVFTRANKLFATLLLVIQKLEEEKILDLAHQAMIEDMLTCYKFADTKWEWSMYSLN